MNDTRTMKIAELKAQIERASYDVDVDAVAEAFVSRMLKVQGALRRADVSALLGETASADIRATA
ncbi:MAG TPA: flagellar biosynthesis anti-sigma factor FlgM [Conexibacter sp.]|nr:flagellar biosynthesis anti-sigma factor FlgM [Conexibacter sp.]